MITLKIIFCKLLYDVHAGPRFLNPKFCPLPQSTSWPRHCVKSSRVWIAKAETQTIAFVAVRVVLYSSCLWTSAIFSIFFLFPGEVNVLFDIICKMMESLLIYNDQKPQNAFLLDAANALQSHFEMKRRFLNKLIIESSKGWHCDGGTPLSPVGIHPLLCWQGRCGRTLSSRRRV